ncbi:MAG: nucleotidyltransferase family protein [Clostridia bacterium]|nr:nucleotidyltransferase family protein [Clostridia bacterium]
MQEQMVTKKYFLEMVSASIKGLPVPHCPDEVDTSLLYKLCVRNAVQGILYLAVQSGAVTLSAENEVKLQKSYMAILAREATQQEEIEYIRNAFNEENIEFMFLKGTHLKSLYPVPEMRFMVDMDILVKEKSMEKGGELILARGFTQEMNNGKDIVLVKKPFLTIELHKMLFVEDYFMHDYFKGVWNRVEKVSSCEYKMPISDLYVYTLAHLAEHYLEAGSCFRPLMDLYLMEKTHTELDFDYINKQFEIIGIDKFAIKIRQLYKSAFDDAEYNDDLITIENYIVFGAPVKNASEVSKVAITKKSKSQRFMESAFPNLKHMKLKYSILKKAPFLLPFFWVVRFFEFVFLKKGSIEQKQAKISNVDQKSTDIMREIFEKSGLK